MVLKLFLCLALALPLALPSRVEARTCAIVGSEPGRLKAPGGAHAAMRFDLLGPGGKLLGRQVVFGGSPDGVVLLSSEAAIINANKTPRVTCAVDNKTVLTPQTIVDSGPQVEVRSMYFGRDAVTVSFYAYEEDFFARRKDEGVSNQLFSVRLDRRSPFEVQVTAKPGQTVTVRFEDVVPGTHRLEFGELEMGGPQMRYYATGLYELDFIQPKIVLGER